MRPDRDGSGLAQYLNSALLPRWHSIRIPTWVGNSQHACLDPSSPNLHHTIAMSGHARKQSSRAALPRRSTKGPLDAPDDPLSPSAATVSSPVDYREQQKKEATPQQTLRSEQPVTNDVDQVPTGVDRDLAFLLEPSIYHPLTQLEVPAPFRRPFPQPPSPTVKISEALKQLDDLLGECDYLRAAHLAGLVLISGAIRSNDLATIFRLLSIRYSCLELSGNVMLAAQEAKALEDLGSTFYYLDSAKDTTAKQDIVPGSPPQHIVPFHFRLQALRLQSIGFSDPRRGVSSLYDLGTECREWLAVASLTSDQRQIWSARLEEIGLRVVNALIEMDDFDCAKRTLESLQPAEDENSGVWQMRKFLLCLKMGLVLEASGVAESMHAQPTEKAIFDALLAMSEDDFESAVSLLSNPDIPANSELLPLARQNLAVAYLYKGDIANARGVLETLVDDGQSFRSLTVNLATVYDLTTDRSRDLKLAMADRISKKQRHTKYARHFSNADFKL
jgi:trafficking protein particle complex subunit 12